MKILIGIGIICIIIIAALIMAIIPQNTTGAFFISEKQPIKIGYIGPLTGSAASIGGGQVKAVELAVNEINSKEGINGRKIELIIEDGACDGKTAINAANKLINIDNVKYIIGGQCSAETIAIAPLAEQNKVIVLSPLSSNPSISSMGDYIFRNYPSDSYQGKIAAQYIKNKIGINNVAVLTSLNDWSNGLKNEFENEFKALGGKVVLIKEYKKDTLDLKSELSEIKNSNAELIYMPDYTASTISAIKQKNELGINTPFFGADAWMDTTIWNEVGDISEGIKFTSTKDNTSQEFKTKFNDSYPNSEITLGATNNYDAVYIISNAIKSCGEDTAKVKECLYNMPAHKGISGITAFDQNGDLRNQAYEIKYIHNKEIETLEIV